MSLLTYSVLKGNADVHHVLVRDMCRPTMESQRYVNKHVHGQATSASFVLLVIAVVLCDVINVKSFIGVVCDIKVKSFIAVVCDVVNV